MLLSGLIGLCSFAYGQTLIRTYYDEFPSIKKEEYHILNGDSSQVDGEYKMFSPSGKVITTGTFEKGLKQGTFTNYYEDGSIQRETIYQNDLREGLTQVFDAQGNKIQEATFINDTLEGELKLYDTSGVLKAVTTFKKENPKERFRNSLRLVL